ncbi:hypothetical protein COU20_03665 [Candidatus Kaiserbacteria bacterium CG10_big_fil_rev_8_21_14_0_10_59_10]|uniref:SHS2 domain-containing protein n=1 Tax=Candidatus Kaiserbacteria bacterium CG10_big_fil_rev_8_21_14_0_10_59_10 TaxID=1974612 RepID=A0A2H0U739_9BACT|nr:MAG: hypothetical protein COU20_03665 [Candidatus Kaiserbacteria bacterium CG10_big_fil_rev_8_21_14_0_10_59_10]
MRWPFLVPGRLRANSVCAIADVESGGVGFAIAELSHTRQEPVRILAYERAVLPHGERGARHTASASLGLLSRVGARVLHSFAVSQAAQKHGHVASAHVILRAPWYSSETHRNDSVYPKAQAIRQRTITELAEQAIRESAGSSLPFESAVLRVLLNGYPTGKPIGKSAVELSVITLSSHSSAKMNARAHTAVSSLLPGRDVRVHSGMRASLAALHEILTRTNTFTIMIVGADMTECIVVRKDEVSQHVRIPFGTSAVIRELSGANGLPDETEHLFKAAFIDGEDSKATSALREKLARAEIEYASRFGAALGSLAERRRLPNECVLITHPFFAPWLETFVTRIDFSPFTVTTHPFNVEVLQNAHVAHAVAWSEDTPPDVAISLAALFVRAYVGK